LYNIYIALFIDKYFTTTHGETAMYQIIKKQTRPNTSVGFYSPQESETLPREFNKIFYDKYIVTGKQINVATSESEDGLTQTITSTWISEEAANEFLNDSEMTYLINDRDLHSSTHNVNVTLISKTTI
jgi:hypothetical protein